MHKFLSVNLLFLPYLLRTRLVEWIDIWAFYYFLYWVRLIFPSGSWYHPLTICWTRINANKDCCKCCCTAWCPWYRQHIPGQSCWCIRSHNNFGGEFCLHFSIKWYSILFTINLYWYWQTWWMLDTTSVQRMLNLVTIVYLQIALKPIYFSWMLLCYEVIGSCILSSLISVGSNIQICSNSK